MMRVCYALHPTPHPKPYTVDPISYTPNPQLPTPRITVAVTAAGKESCITVHHRGGVNTGMAMDWTFESFPDLEEVLVIGAPINKVLNCCYFLSAIL